MCETIAFPLLASGNNGFDLGLAYDIVKSSIESFAGVNLKKIFLVIYSDNNVTFLKGRGVSVSNIQGNTIVAKEKGIQKQKVKQLGKEGKEVAVKILEEQISKALNYLKDEENREKVIAAGISISQMVIRIATKK